MTVESACAMQTEVTVVALDKLSEQNYRIRLACPAVAARILPGQFFMLRTPDRSDPLLGRPFALYDTYEEAGRPAGLDVGFHVIGKMTGLMESLKPGQTLDLWGPLGNGFPAFETKHLIQVAGGIGYTPFVAVTREALQEKTYGSPVRQGIRAERATMIYGVRSAAYRADLSDWNDLDRLETQICTDDGSEGHHGLVTDLLDPLLKEADGQETVVLTCGPLRMMQAVAESCAKMLTPCWASLETPMACGFGACFSCVVPVKTEENEWDYRRSCMEGPVFPAEKILWSSMA